MADLTEWFWVDKREQPTTRVILNVVRGDAREAMNTADASQRLTVLSGGFASNSILDFGHRHHVAFVTGINKDASLGNDGFVRLRSCSGYAVLINLGMFQRN